MPIVSGGNVVTSTNQIADGAIFNADINALAAIVRSKLDFGAGLVDADIAAAAAIALSKLATDPLARANHTGTQPSSTISDFNSAVLALATANFPPQDVNLHTGTTNQSGGGSAGGLASTSEADGSVMFQAWSTGGVINIQRLLKDTRTSNYYVTHTTTFNIGNSGNMSLGLGIVGSNLYLVLQDGATKKVTRYAKADLSGAQAMTWSGTARAGTTWSDGTFLYIYNGTSSQFDKCSISGTTITNTGTTITLTSSGVVAGAICDGVSVWTTDSNYAGSTVFNKYPIAGGAATASLTVSMLNAAAYPQGVGSGLFLASSNMLGIPYWYVSNNETTDIGTQLHISAVSTP